MYPNIQTNSALCYVPTGNFSKPVGGSLDTLGELRNCTVEHRDDKLLKRAKSKHFTGKMAIALAELHSPLEKYYRNAFYCNHSLTQSGQTLSGKYCGTRICNTCNRIRTAKLISGYEQAIKKFDDPQFVTLTVPNVQGDLLSQKLDEMYKKFRKITDRLRKKKLKYAGLRKSEVTVNVIRDDFHPHFHLIVDSLEAATYFVKAWLELNPTSNIKGQDIRKADENSMKELFKYTAKVVSNINGKQVIMIKAVDTIMQALRKRRIIQPFGGLIKYVDEEIREEDLKADRYNIPEYELMSWTWEGTDWINEYGETLTGYEPSDTIKAIEFG